MTRKKLLIGSLSNDLYRVAELTHRGSYKAAYIFLAQAKKWAKKLKKEKLKPYIKVIINDFNKQESKKLNLTIAEKHLMYSILLQNYALYLR